MDSWIWILIALVLGGSCDAVMDTLRDHFPSSVFKNRNPYFWNPEISWMNKWAKVPARGVHDNIVDLKKERFFGSSTFLVWLTDAWHLFKMIRNTMIAASVAIALVGIGWHTIVYLIIIKTVWSLMFELFYSKILEK